MDVNMDTCTHTKCTVQRVYIYIYIHVYGICFVLFVIHTILIIFTTMSSVRYINFTVNMFTPTSAGACNQGRMLVRPYVGMA